MMDIKKPEGTYKIENMQQMASVASTADGLRIEGKNFKVTALAGCPDMLLFACEQIKQLQSRLAEAERERERHLEAIDKLRVAFPLACTVATDGHLLYPANQYNLIVDILNQAKRIESGEVEL